MKLRFQSGCHCVQYSVYISHVSTLSVYGHWCCGTPEEPFWSVAPDVCGLEFSPLYTTHNPGNLVTLVVRDSETGWLGQRTRELGRFLWLAYSSFCFHLDSLLKSVQWCSGIVMMCNQLCAILSGLWGVCSPNGRSDTPSAASFVRLGARLALVLGDLCRSYDGRLRYYEQ